MSRRHPSLRAAATSFALLLTWAASGAAQTRDPAAAEALFDDARKLMRQERFEEACAKLEASERLDPGVGTLLNLGDCLEKAGRSASAWARFREAASAAALAGQSGREREARSRADALERRLVRVVLRVAPAQEGGPEMTIERDGVVLDPKIWGTPLPMDPGAHVLVARAPHHRPWSTKLEIGVAEAGTVRTVEVPALEAEIARPEAPAPVTSPVVPRSSWSTQHTVGVAMGGGAVVALGLAGVLALVATSIHDDAEAQCNDVGCSSAAREEARSAGQLADGATVSLVAAGVLAASAIIVFLTAPSSSTKSAGRGAPALLVF